MSHLVVKLKSDRQWHKVKEWHEPLNSWKFDTECGMVRAEGTASAVDKYLHEMEEYDKDRRCLACWDNLGTIR